MNLRTLGDMNKDNKDSKDKKKPNNSFTGGEASGLAVENPDDRKNIQDILDQAQKSSERPDAPNDKSKVNCKITLFSNGFQINEEPFRDYNEAKNKQFIQELKTGRVPQDLRNQYPNGLYVGLDDRTSDTYTPPPPPAYIAFSGSGVSLGGPQVPQVQQQPMKNIEILKQSEVIQVDKSKPTTQINVRLFDGQSVVLVVNLSTTVSAIYNHIKNLVKPGQRVMVFIAGYPPRPITNLNQTVEEADLMDSEIRQTF